MTDNDARQPWSAPEVTKVQVVSRAQELISKPT
jgi:hypothetical protein